MESTHQPVNGITEGPIRKQLLLFFFPILLGTFFQQLYNTVDAVVVGNFIGKEALAAVGGSTSVLINLLVGLFVGVASGGSVVIAQYFGENSAEKMHCCFAKRMRKLFRKNEKSVLRFCNKSSKTKRAFTKVLMPCKRPF